ncbi:MAG: phosphatidylserine decarboxylase [Vicinamibacterales bacterium]
MFIDRAGWPFVLGALVLSLAAGWWFGRNGAVPFLVLAAFFLFFFRDPGRTPPAGAGVVVSPADGRVMVAGGAPAAGAPEGDWQVITIFLSPLDVHVNRAPVDGRVTRVEYHPGTFLPAYKPEAGSLNEWSEVWFDHDGIPVVCRQIVGILARRIVTRLEPGDEVTRGQRFGVMKFGSRIDLFLPPGTPISVARGDRVVAGETILATLER